MVQPATPLFFPWSHSQFLCLLFLSRTRGWRSGGCAQLIASCLRCSFPLMLFSSFNMECHLWRNFSTYFINVGPAPWAGALHKLIQHGPFHGVQCFRNRLLQCGSPTGSQLLMENMLSARHSCSLPQHGISMGCSFLKGMSTYWGMEYFPVCVLVINCTNENLTNLNTDIFKKKIVNTPVFPLY